MLLRRIRYGRGLRLGPRTTSTSRGLLRGQGAHDHGIIHRILIRLLNVRQFHNLLAQNLLRGGEGSHNGRGRRTLGVNQINLRRGVARPALEVPVGGAHRHALGGRGLADGAAGAAKPAPAGARRRSSAFPDSRPSSAAGKSVWRKCPQVQLTSSWTCLPGTPEPLWRYRNSWRWCSFR